MYVFGFHAHGFGRGKRIGRGSGDRRALPVCRARALVCPFFSRRSLSPPRGLPGAQFLLSRFGYFSDRLLCVRDPLAGRRSRRGPFRLRVYARGQGGLPRARLSVRTAVARKKAEKMPQGRARKKIFGRDLKVIYTAHGFHFYKGAPILNWLLYYPIEKWLSKYTDILITINEEDYNIAKKKFKAKKIELVHGVGVDIEKFNFEMSKEEQHILRSKIGLKDDDFVIIQIGELNKNKNQIMLIESMRQLVKKDNKIKAIIVGKGVLQECYRKKIEKYKLKDNVLLLGYRTDIKELLKISNCAVALSFREGLGINVIEEISSKVLVIVTRNRGHKELIHNEKFIIDYNDREKLIETILNVKDNKISCKVLETNYENMQKYDIKNIMCVMKRIYMEG